MAIYNTSYTRPAEIRLESGTRSNLPDFRETPYFIMYANGEAVEISEQAYDKILSVVPELEKCNLLNSL